jgi:hypothetical protein
MAENAKTQDSQQPPPPDPELRRLDPLVGTWKARDQTQDRFKFRNGLIYALTDYS